ncbi:MAG: hypothetical protein ABIQ16_18145 [Polyangiaceae bacterium]
MTRCRFEVSVGTGIDRQNREVIKLARTSEDGEPQGQNPHDQQNGIDDLANAEEVRRG